MIHQMMMLMQLEMQLRQQALVSYQESQDPVQRMQRLDDVMALNEQLNEVGSILGMLLNAPLERGMAVRLPAASTVSAPASHQGPATARGRVDAPVSDHSTLGSSLLRSRLRVLDTVSSGDEDNDDVSADETPDLSYATSTVDDVYDDDDLSDDGFDRAGSSALGSYNSYNVDSLTISITHQARGNADRVSAVSGDVNNAAGHPLVVGRTDADRRQVADRTSAAVNSRPSALLARRRDQSRQITVNQPTVSVTVNELHLGPAARSRAGSATTTTSTVALPPIQPAAGGAIAAGHTPLTQNSERTQPRQSTGSQGSAAVSSSTPRQLEPLPTNRSSRALSSVHGNMSVSTVSQQTMPASSNVAQQGSDAITANSNQPSADNSSSVLTEPWPIRSSATEPHLSTSVSANRSTAAQRSGRQETSRLTETRGYMVRGSHAAVGVAQGSRRVVQEMPGNRPAPHQLRRSSMRNALGRPAGPASMSTQRPSAARTPHVIPLPHPPSARAGRLSTSTTQSSSNNILRPRRRSEIAHEIMFPPQKDTEQ